MKEVVLDKKIVVSCDKCCIINKQIYKDGSDELCARCLMKKYISEKVNSDNLTLQSYIDVLCEEFADKFFEEITLKGEEND